METRKNPKNWQKNIYCIGIIDINFDSYFFHNFWVKNDSLSKMGNAIKRFKQSLKDDKDFLEAAKNNDLEKVRTFLKSGIQPNTTEFEFMGMEWTALHYAAFWGSFDVALYLIDNYSFNIDSEDYWGWTPLHVAVMNGQTKMVKLLLECGAKTTSKTRLSYPLHGKTDNKTPIQLAKEIGRWDILELLEKRKSGIFHESVIKNANRVRENFYRIK